MRAGWIRLNVLLPNSPKVARVAAVVGCSPDAALGLMLRWLCWVDLYCATEETQLRLADVDDLFAVPYAGRALAAIGWVRTDENGVVRVCDFEKYLDPTSKVRAAETERKAKFRMKKKGGAK